MTRRSLNAQSFLQRARREWRYTLQGGTWLIAIVSSFVLPPPLWDFKENVVWFRFSHFLVTALIGLMFIPMRALSAKRHTRVWWVITAATLGLAIIAFFEYQALRGDWSRSYDKNRIVIGQTYTKEALDYREEVYQNEKRVISDEELIMDSAGDAQSIWDAGEIRYRRLILAGIYIANICLFAISIITLIQSQYCSTRKR